MHDNPFQKPQLAMQVTAPTITAMLHTAIRRIWKGEYDHLTPSEAICYDNTLSAHCCSYDLDLGLDLDLRPSRFTKLLRDYLDPSDTHRFLSRATEVATGRSKEGATTVLQTRRAPNSDTKHRFGNCILGFTYRGLRSSHSPAPNAPTISIQSRTAYITHIGCLDLAVAYALAQEIARRAEIPFPQSVGLVWQSTSLQFHTLKSLPFLLGANSSCLTQTAARENHILCDARRYNDLQKYTGAWHDKFLGLGTAKLNGESKFGPVRRVQQVYARTLANKRPSHPIATWCSLNALTTQCR